LNSIVEDEKPIEKAYNAENKFSGYVYLGYYMKKLFRILEIDIKYLPLTL